MKTFFKYYWSTLGHKAWVALYLIRFSALLFLKAICGHRVKYDSAYDLYSFCQASIKNDANFVLLPYGKNGQLISIYQKTKNYGLLRFCFQLVLRGICHDFSKLGWAEANGFIQHIDRLANVEYGTPEYTKMLLELRPTVSLHYTRNSHHPEHFKDDGILGMNIFDVVEMFYDWKASGKRGPNGSLHKSISIQTKKLNLDPLTAMLFVNSI